MRGYLLRESAMIDLHYWTTPNGHKITLFLEEAGLDYHITPVHIGKGEQFQPEFLRIAPNNRIPAIIDNTPADGGAPISIFESGATCCTWPTRPAASSRRICAAATSRCNGCSGRWADSVRWRDRPTTSRSTRRSRCRTP